MRVLYLSNADSVHMIKWLRHAVARGHEVHVASFAEHQQITPHIAGVTYHTIPGRPGIGYVVQGQAVKRILRNVRPDILHAHYVSGYGTLATSTGFHPYVLSAWGSDVYEFPEKSPLHRFLTVRNLSAADWVCSTSQAMARRVRTLVPGLENLTVTPFGVDTQMFAPLGAPWYSRETEGESGVKGRTRFLPPVDRNDVLTIGTVRTLSWVYGIDTLIRAFAIVVARKPVGQLRLVIVGDGPDRLALEALAQRLGIGSFTLFVGRVPHEDVPALLGQFDIFVAPSRRESFGVAVLEAESCGLPVIVSNTGGLPEVVVDGETGFLVPVGDENALAERLALLIGDSELRQRLGLRAREYVREKLDWAITAKALDTVYELVTRRFAHESDMESYLASGVNSGGCSDSNPQ